MIPEKTMPTTEHKDITMMRLRSSLTALWMSVFAMVPIDDVSAARSPDHGVNPIPYSEKNIKPSLENETQNLISAQLDFLNDTLILLDNYSLSDIYKKTKIDIKMFIGRLSKLESKLDDIIQNSTLSEEDKGLRMIYYHNEVINLRDEIKEYFEKNSLLCSILEICKL